MSHPIKFWKKDITKVLSKEKGEVILNPSITLWKDDLFLCSYRVYIRYPGLNTVEYEEDPLMNPNHPWLGGEGSTTWWSSPAGYDETRIALVRIRGNNVKRIRTFGSIPGVDARLFTYRPNLILILTNVWLKSKGVSLKRTNCENGCMLMVLRTIKVLDNGKSLDVSKGIFLCPEKSEKIEKNWGFWRSPGDELMVSYGITPHHEVFRLNVKGDTITCPNIESISGTNDFFERFSSFYKGACPNHFPWCGSTSTPAIRRPNGNYLAFGHFKYLYKEAAKNLNHDTNLYRFNELLFEKQKGLHPQLVYLMFLYEFSSDPPYSVLKVSNMFIPESKYALVFASGLTYSERHQKYIMSYGDHDSETWILMMSDDEVSTALMSPPEPKDVKFLLL